MNYKVHGLDSGGHLVALELQAATSEEAIRLGGERGLEVLGVDTATPGWFASVSRMGGGKFPLLLFNQELLALLEAGLTIVEAIETLLEKESNAATRQTLAAVVASLREGRTLSASLEAQTAAFPALYIAAIRASERTGSLVESLRRYIAYQRQVEEVRKKVVAASIYPALLLLVGGLVVLFLLVYVIPKFSHIYADSGRELPFASMLLMRWGALVENHGGAITLAVLAALALAGYGLTRPSLRALLRELLWGLPVLGERMRIYQLTRFYRTLGMLASAGIPLMAALDQVSGLLDQRLRARLAEARGLIREGQPLSFALEHSGLSTPVALRLLRVGERTGQIGSMMDRIADFHEEELGRWIDWASRLFEPLLMTAMGIVIGGIVVLMYVPIFELAGSIQ